MGVDSKGIYEHTIGNDILNLSVRFISNTDPSDVKTGLLVVKLRVYYADSCITHCGKRVHYLKLANSADWQALQPWHCTGFFEIASPEAKPVLDAKSDRRSFFMLVENTSQFQSRSGRCVLHRSRYLHM
jgi:hypothetical protein